MSKPQLNFISISLICLAALLLQPELESRLYGTTIELPERMTISDTENVIHKTEETPTDGGGVKETPSSDTMVTTLNLKSINAMDAAGLEQINGIGPVLAKRIVDYRTEHGPFKTVKDLAKVKGIGEKKLKTIESQLSKEE